MRSHLVFHCPQVLIFYEFALLEVEAVEPFLFLSNEVLFHSFLIFLIIAIIFIISVQIREMCDPILAIKTDFLFFGLFFCNLF